MSDLAKILSLSYNSAVATKSSALKTYYRSVRLIRDGNDVIPGIDSKYTNVLLCGRCIDAETRMLYVSYIDTLYSSAWVIEINLDSRRQEVVYYDKYNAIGFDPSHKFYNQRAVHGRLVWTDNLNPIYQMDIARAKKSYLYKIGYGQYPITLFWNITATYGIDQVVANGNYFYKNLIFNNTGIEPRTDDGTNWAKLCLIEDAYFSMNVKNFYFEPIPPTHPPEVTYQSDDTRKINNLRQTLFQCAYRYVYMDWRKSTFSPASIVPVPQAEEETATGLANEQISLNNKLQIVVDSGGEEVRAIEIVGRSSQDPSKWFLIETINKFEEQERAGEISRTSEPEFIALGMSLPIATTTGISEPQPGDAPMGMTIIKPDTINSYVFADVTGLSWQSNEGGVAKTTLITALPDHVHLTSFPAWLTVLGGNGLSLSAGMTIQNQETISAYPVDNNLGAGRSGFIVLTTDQGDIEYITVTQSPIIVVPPTPITPVMSIDPDDSSAMVLIGSSAGAMSSSADVNYSFVADHPGYASGNPFTMFWRALVNGIAAGNGSFTANDEVSNTGILTLNNVLAAGDVVQIYLSAQSILEAITQKTDMTISPLQPEPTNSSVAFSETGLLWTADQSGLVDADTAVVSCPPSLCTIVSMPDWITVQGVAGYSLYAGWTIQHNEMITVFPTSDNLGNARSGSIVLINEFGDGATMFVSQASAAVPPTGVPIACTLQAYALDFTGLAILGSYASALSGQKNISWSASIAHSGHGAEAWTMYWRLKVNGTQQGSGSFDAYVGSNTGVIVSDITLLEGDIVVIEFSSITF